MHPRSLAHALLALLAGAAGVWAHVRLINPSNGAPLYWSAPGSIGIVINDAGSDDVADDSDEVAIRLAIEEWNAVTGTNVRLIEDVTPAQQARTDYQSTSIHMVLFDETNASGYFPMGSGTVAITPVFFFANGLIADADVLFNGAGFSFTTEGASGAFDVGDVAVHELGHLLGLDHSAWAGASMYPYVDPLVSLHRSVSSDEVAGMRDISASVAFGQLTGTVRRSADGTPVAGAHVVARDSAGRTVASILTAPSGAFAIRRLPPETYTVYAVPLGTGGLDAPVTASNLSSGLVIQTNFQAGTYPGTTTITGTEAIALGPLDVDGDIPLNLGTSIDRFPMHVEAGSVATLLLRGSGLNPGSTLVAADPDLLIASPMFFGSQVSFQVIVPSGEAPGHVDLAVTNVGGETSVLPAALEITPPAPTVLSVSPSLSSKNGGTPVTITGTGFNAGARVVIGDRIYTDGVGGTSVDSPTSITLTTGVSAPGLHDVVVIDASGVEGRMQSTFTMADVPRIDSVFPDVGHMAGGTEVVITGQDFLAGAAVRINGVDQGAPLVESESVLRFSTQPGSVGPQILEVEVAGNIAMSGFTYSSQPDPLLSDVDPGVVRNVGGATVRLTGANFRAGCQVVFGADPQTGAGGDPAPSVVLVDASTLDVTTPDFSAVGSTTVLVSDTGTGQSTMLSGALTVAAPSSGNGGCHTVPVSGPGDGRRSLDGGLWMVAVLAALWLHARRGARPDLRGAAR